MEGPQKPTVRHVLRALGKQYPFDRAAPWDNVGLLAGDENKEVEKALVTVDITPQVVEVAISSQYDLIVSHHPLFIDPLKNVNNRTVEGGLLLKIISGGCALISAHTNADLAPRGVSRALAEKIGLINVRPMKEYSQKNQFKVVVFIPLDSLEKVMDAAFSAGAGVIGDYRSCSFRVRGTGSFLPLEDASPTAGLKGEVNSVDEMRVEFLVNEGLLNDTIDAVRDSHPYEEAAIDIYPLAGGNAPGWLGIMGSLDRTITFEGFLGIIAGGVKPKILRYAGDLARKVKKIGILGGSGGNFVREAIGSGVHVFVTGDLKHHQVHELIHSNVMAVDIGHYDSEKYVMDMFMETLDRAFERSITVDRYEESTEYMRVYAV